jgi:hypothetical protein
MLMDSNQQVEPQEKKKTPKGRAKKRITYTRRFVNVTLTGGKRKVCIFQPHYRETLSDLCFADEPQPNLIDNQHLGGETEMALLYMDRINLDQTWD